MRSFRYTFPSPAPVTGVFGKCLSAAATAEVEIFPASVLLLYCYFCARRQNFGILWIFGIMNEVFPVLVEVELRGVGSSRTSVEGGVLTSIR